MSPADKPIRSNDYEKLTNWRSSHNCDVRTNSDIQSSSDRVSDPQFLQSWRPSLLSIRDSPGYQTPVCPGLASKCPKRGLVSRPQVFTKFVILQTLCISRRKTRTSVHSGKLWRPGRHWEYWIRPLRENAAMSARISSVQCGLICNIGFCFCLQ